jgi:polysaccharide pyruvyl transferase WcaK-like protein
MSTQQIFIYGYHGFRNVGAEARLVAIVDNLHDAVPDAELVVSTFSRSNLRWLHGVKLVYFNPAAYAVSKKPRRVIASSDVMVLSEGNMLTDEFSKHMVMTFVCALEHANARGVKSVGMALDSGQLSDGIRQRVVDALETTTLLTVRSPGAAEELRALGVSRPIEVTADCALSMRLPTDEEREKVRRQLGLGGRPAHAIAPVDFYMWPAKIAPLGRPDEYVRWPFKATWADNGRRRSAELVADWVGYGRHLLSTDPEAIVVVLVMDPSDRTIAARVASGIDTPERTRLLSGADLTPREMSAAFSFLSSMSTSRYHAMVLPLAYGVPFIALGHDTRTRFLCDQLGMSEYFVPFDARDRLARLVELSEQLAADQSNLRTRILVGTERLRAQDARNYAAVAELLATGNGRTGSMNSEEVAGSAGAP